MATNFNSTNYPFLRVIGKPFNIKDFRSDVFNLVVNEKFKECASDFRKNQRGWYASHRDKFRNDVVIMDDYYKVGSRCSAGLFDEEELFARGEEHSGVICYTVGSYGCFEYTIKFRNQDSIINDDVIVPGPNYDGRNAIDIRIMAIGSASKNRPIGISSCVGYAFMNDDGDNWGVDYSCSFIKENEELNDNVIAGFKLMFSNILALYYARLKHIGITEILLPHGTPVDDVNVVNYSPFDITYIKDFDKLEQVMRSMQSEAIDSEDDDEFIMAGSCWSLYKRREWYVVNHSPIDYTTTASGETDYGNHWGLEHIFRKVRKDSDTYKMLYDMFEFDEPRFIGCMYIPITDDISMSIHRVYVVRCINNGTTYFVSKKKKALSPFMD